MKRYSLRDNLISAAIGIAIGVPLSIAASKSWTKTPVIDAVPINNDEVLEEGHMCKAPITSIVDATPMPTVTEALTTTEAPAQEEEIKEPSLTEEKIQELAILVHAEAGNQDQIGKRLVADVVMNRVDSEQFPDTIHDVIVQKYQFSTIWDGAFDRAKETVNESDYAAVEAEMEERLDTEIVYFTAGGYGQYGTHAYQHGDHYFCKE